MWDPRQQKFWVATNPSAFNKRPSVSEFKDIQNVRIHIEELAEHVRQGHPHCDPVGLNQQGRPGWTDEMAEAAGPFLQRPYKDSPRAKNNSYLTNLVMMESDGDATLETALASQEVQTYCSAIWTSCSHKKKASENGIDDRFRMGFVLGRRLETFHDSEEYTDPHWQLEAVWDWIHANVIVPGLKIQGLSDKSGREAARQFFGCNENHQIGLGDLAEEYPLPCEVHLLNGGLDAALVNQILEEAEPRYLKQAATTNYTFDSGFAGTDELTVRDANIINWILMNGILNDAYATDRDKWFTVGRVLKKYDPDGEIFFDGFVQFSQQCTDASKRDSRDQLEQTWEQLPKGEDTVATFNCIKTYATESNEEWRNLCPYYGGTTLMTKATKQFVSGSISNASAELIQRMNDRDAIVQHEADLRESFERRIANIAVSTNAAASQSNNNSDF